MTHLLKRRRLTKEDLEEIVNNSEDSEFSDDSESYANDIASDSEDQSSDDVIDTDIHHGTWTNVGTERPRFPFIGKPGLNVKIENSENPLEFFELFIIPKISELICKETNRYAEQFLKKNPHLKEHSRVHKWKDTNEEEIMTQTIEVKLHYNFVYCFLELITPTFFCTVY